MLSHGGYAAVVDPGDATPVIQALEFYDLELKSILITHHHADHIGGVHALQDYGQQQGWSVKTYAPRNPTLVFPYQAVIDQEIVHLDELECSFMVMEIPGHTSDHIAYWGNHALFCGDTLFGGGCGRVFDSTAANLYQSLQRLATLPDETLIYCAHEYTLGNLDFAKSLEPENLDILARITACQSLRKLGLPTLPSTLSLEKATNPFLRCHLPSIRKAALIEDSSLNEQKQSSEEDIFTHIRHLKNNYQS